MSAKQTLSSFARSRDGAVAPLLGFMMLVLIGCMGIAIDIGRAAVVKSRLVDALDAAGLAVGARSGTTDFAADARRFVDANFKANYAGATVNTVTAVPNADKSVITLTATATMPTTLMRLFGNNTVTVSHSSEVTRASTGLELVMVLDNTGSMEMSGSMPGLKAAANLLVDQLFGSATTAEDLYIGVVPFSHVVNIGTDHAAWTDVNTTSRSYYPSLWTGCVEERTGGLDQTDDTPATAKFKAFYAPDDNYNDWIRYYGTSVYYVDYRTQQGPGAYCPTPITLMTNVKSKVTSGINAMRAQGATMINVGAIWGWRMLSPKWRGTWDGDMATNKLPLAYDTKNMKKAVVLMTDGENSFGDENDYNDKTVYTAYGYRAEQRLGAGTKKFAAANKELDNRLTTVCTSMKTAGIVVYTVAFDNPDAATKTLLQNCASSTAFYFDSSNTTELLSDFQKIYDSLSSLRVSK